MKAIMTVYSQTFSEKVDHMLDRMGIKGFTRWENVVGRGSETGVPHMGTHTWPEQNSAMLTILEEERVEEFLVEIRNLNSINEEVGVRAFVWDIIAGV